jgi:hypothetical protein
MAHIAATNAHIAANHQLATHDTLHHIIAQLNATADVAEWLDQRLK